MAKALQTPQIAKMIDLHQMLNEGLEDIASGNTISAEKMMKNFKDKWREEGRLSDAK